MTRLALALAVPLALASCNHKPTTGARIPSREEMKPGELYADRATLLYGGTEVAVTVTRQASGSQVKFILTAHGQVFETETYEDNDGSFAFVGIDDQFEPPLPLLKFPMRIGDKWEWKGTLKSATVSHPATATVTTARDNLFLAGQGDLETLRSDVRLFLDSGTPTPAERKLTFWFVQGRGIVRREIGTATIRQPAKPASSGGDAGKGD